MNVLYSKYQLEKQQEFASFFEKEIKTFAVEIDRKESLSDEVLHKVIASGYLGALIPKEYDGLELDPADQFWQEARCYRSAAPGW